MEHLQLKVCTITGVFWKKIFAPCHSVKIGAHVCAQKNVLARCTLQHSLTMFSWSRPLCWWCGQLWPRSRNDNAESQPYFNDPTPGKENHGKTTVYSLLDLGIPSYQQPEVQVTRSKQLPAAFVKISSAFFKLRVAGVQPKWLLGRESTPEMSGMSG